MPGNYIARCVQAHTTFIKNPTNENCETQHIIAPCLRKPKSEGFHVPATQNETEKKIIIRIEMQVLHEKQ